MTAPPTRHPHLPFIALLLAAALLAGGCSAPFLQGPTQAPSPTAAEPTAVFIPDWAAPDWRAPLKVPSAPPRRNVRLMEPVRTAAATAEGEVLEIDPPSAYPEFSLEPSPEELIEQILDPAGLQLIEAAMGQIGAPYAFGGSSPAGFDCSGLVQFAYRTIGLEVPRSSQELYQQADKVAMSELQPGDLLFFRIYRRRISHVGIFVGEDRFVHAPSRGKRVSISSLDEPYWSRHLVGAGRLR